MARDKNLDSLRELDSDVLNEVIREGEAMLQAQFSAATASDQRAIAWTGFLITLVIAAIGATASIAISGKYFGIACLTGSLSLFLSLAAFKSIRVFQPSLFAIPGNRPENWLPSEWESDKPRNLKQARIEQARCLNNQIADNVSHAAHSAKRLRHSINITIFSVIFSAIYICLYIAVLYKSDILFYYQYMAEHFSQYYQFYAIIGNQNKLAVVTFSEISVKTLQVNAQKKAGSRVKPGMTGIVAWQ
jgi:hypothetical protein